MNTAWFLIWIGWGLAFGVLEYRALRNPDVGDTLSENLRHVFGTTKTSGRAHRIFGWITFIGFFVWFIPHILIGANY